MITSITLKNFKSFGEEQTIPLSPITVLVGPNNSGKSSFMSLGRFLQKAVEANNPGVAVEEEGGPSFCFHSPRAGDGIIGIGWVADEGIYSSRLTEGERGLVQLDERLEHAHSGRAWPDPAQTIPSWKMPLNVPLSGLIGVMRRSADEFTPFQKLCAPLVYGREIKLALAALRADNKLVPLPRLGSNGSDLSTVLALWRGADPDRAEKLEEFVRACLPEIRHVLVKPAPTPGYQRLWVKQSDGVHFDAQHISDGVLCFIALAMHAIEAEPSSLIFMEEPEQSIHPRRLGDLVDLLRRIVHEKQCQIVIATHSPVLLHQFRDEPDAILLFRRGEHGTLVQPLTVFPDLMAALDEKHADPGEMLVNGFLNEPS